MATLNELVQVVARAEGLDPPTVTLIARLVREAELITTGGRGPSAAVMGLSDAANLLIAVNATKRVNDAAKIVALYRAMVPHEYVSASIRHPLKDSGTFGEALEELFRAGAAAELPEILAGRGVPKHIRDSFRQGLCAVFVTFTVTYCAATIKLRPSDGSSILDPTMRSDPTHEFVVTFYPIARMSKKVRRPPGSISYTTVNGHVGDCVMQTTISNRTILAVAELIQRDQLALHEAVGQVREDVASLKTHLERFRRARRNLN